jgi:predicted deacylase
MRKVFLTIIGVLLVAIIAWIATNLLTQKSPEVIEPMAEVPPETEPATKETPTTTTSTIGTSVEGREIEAYTFGSGEDDLLFVGGIHGGYEWNSIALAYEMIAHLETNSDAIPENITVHIIPNLNPDGLYLATGREGKIAYNDPLGESMHAGGIGRMNANKVDLNRNFACKWKPESQWRGNTVNAGTAAFSEPEAQALRDYVLTITPDAVVFWHSMANNVYASECENGVLPETLTIMNAYANAAGYGAVPVFDAYEVTGDAEGWLASIGIPAITVELGSRTSIEWSKNLAGTEALLNWYGK